MFSPYRIATACGLNVEPPPQEPVPVEDEKGWRESFAPCIPLDMFRRILARELPSYIKIEELRDCEIEGGVVIVASGPGESVRVCVPGHLLSHIYGRADGWKASIRTIRDAFDTSHRYSSG